VTPCQPLPTPEHPKPRRHDPAVEPHEDKGTGVAEPVPSLATVDHSNGDRQQETGDARTGESAPQLPTGELVAAHNRESTNVLVSQTHPTRSGHDSVLLNNAAEDLGCGPAGSATPPPRPNRGPMTIRGQSSPGLGVNLRTTENGGKHAREHHLQIVHRYFGAQRRQHFGPQTAVYLMMTPGGGLSTTTTSSL
jgi:hypothetical protein